MQFYKRELEEPVSVPDKRRRNWTNAEKVAIVRKTYEPGGSVSVTARQHGIAASMLFRWRKMERNGELALPDEGHANTVPVAELLAAREQIVALQRALGAMTLENQLRALEVQHLKRVMGPTSAKALVTRDMASQADMQAVLERAWGTAHNAA